MTRFLIDRSKRALRDWIDRADGQNYVARFNRTKRFRRHVKISVSYDGELYLVEQGDEILAVARKPRIHFQKRGLLSRQRKPMQEYLLPEGLLQPGNIVVDCGANVGEFAIICAREGANVWAFEPDRREFLALQRNAQNRTIVPIQRALWNKNGEMSFFDSNDQGDSSLIDSGGSSENYSVQTQRLDDVPEIPSSKIRLIKLEAEGAEPEILEGMTEILTRTEFLCIDMGPERGVAKENTVAECTDALYKAGFKMRAFNPARCTALFEHVQAQ